MIEINSDALRAWDPLCRHRPRECDTPLSYVNSSLCAPSPAQTGMPTGRIGRLPAFAGLPAPDLEALARLSGERRVPAGDVLFRRGEGCASVFGLLDGSVKLVRRPGGRETVMELLGPGALIGETALFSGCGHEGDAVTLTGCRLLSLPALPLLRHLQDAPRTALALLGHMSRRIDRLESRVESHVRFSAEQAVAGFLLEHCDGNGQLSRTGAACGRRDLSALLGLRPETLSRALSRFRRAGWVRERGDGRQVVDRTALAALLPGDVGPAEQPSQRALDKA